PLPSRPPFQQIASRANIVIYANTSSLKKMPHMRARRCSLSAAVASRSTNSRSHGPPACPPPSVMFRSQVIDVAVALFDAQAHQPRTAARPAQAASARRFVVRAVSRAYQIASLRVEELRLAPVEFHRH